MNPFDALLDSFRKIVRDEIAAAVKSQPKPKLTYTTAEAAEILNVPETWLATAAREGRVPCLRLGHYVRFKLADLENFAANGETNVA
ncbi:MAG TPA: helix-turn-helix domain-containing protein [Candidatus Binatia bacterium]